MSSSSVFRFTSPVSLTILFLLPQLAGADHPFDPNRYAYELFSEDEIALSEYASEMPEAEVEKLLTETWKKLDDAAEKTKGMDPASARKAIQAEVRGAGGIADRFRTDAAKKAEEFKPSTKVERVKQAIRHPAVWALAAAFVAALVWINRRRPA